MSMRQGYTSGSIRAKVVTICAVLDCFSFPESRGALALTPSPLGRATPLGNSLSTIMNAGWWRIFQGALNRYTLSDRPIETTRAAAPLQHVQTARIAPRELYE